MQIKSNIKKIIVKLKLRKNTILCKKKIYWEPFDSPFPFSIVNNFKNDILLLDGCNLVKTCIYFFSGLIKHPLKIKLKTDLGLGDSEKLQGRKQYSSTSS